ncbi:MAG TPA: zf-HC2 domain-containing protein [Thermodesulfobacteriota bacterium]|nr:zf-HC2 domain-containing protein [Deltaproteobacteria bacterium]HNU72516.1 zf-HC2 domain-containing protein [Thermodesulfobacteriota bacterium]
MGCSEFLELVSAYIDDELTEKETKRLLDHLETCESCTHILSELTLQKETVASLSGCYEGPNPPDHFATSVMALIASESPSKSRLNPVRAFFSHFTMELTTSWRKPAFAVSCALLIGLGAFAGVVIKNQTESAQLLSVYELQASSENQYPAEEEDTDSRFFDHFARSSAETFATTPCLLEYAAYTCNSSNE